MPSASSVRDKRKPYRCPRAITPHNERADMILSTLRTEPIASTLPNEPIDPIEKIDPTEPIDMNEFLHPIHKMEFVEAMLHLDEFADLGMKISFDVGSMKSEVGSEVGSIYATARRLHCACSAMQ